MIARESSLNEVKKKKIICLQEWFHPGFPGRKSFSPGNAMERQKFQLLILGEMIFILREDCCEFSLLLIKG